MRILNTGEGFNTSSEDEAILDMRLPGSERVRVLLKLLRARQMSVELPAAQIQPRRQRRR